MPRRKSASDRNILEAALSDADRFQQTLIGLLSKSPGVLSVVSIEHRTLNLIAAKYPGVLSTPQMTLVLNWPHPPTTSPELLTAAREALSHLARSRMTPHSKPHLAVFSLSDVPQSIRTHVSSELDSVTANLSWCSGDELFSTFEALWPDVLADEAVLLRTNLPKFRDLAEDLTAMSKAAQHHGYHPALPRDPQFFVPLQLVRQFSNHSLRTTLIPFADPEHLSRQWTRRSHAIFRSEVQAALALLPYFQEWNALSPPGSTRVGLTLLRDVAEDYLRKLVQAIHELQVTKRESAALQDKKLPDSKDPVVTIPHVQRTLLTEEARLASQPWEKTLQRFHDLLEVRRPQRIFRRALPQNRTELKLSLNSADTLLESDDFSEACATDAFFAQYSRPHGFSP